MDAHQAGLSEYEQETKYGGQRAWPRLHEAKLLLVASTGFFIDAYDLFAINLVVPILNILLFNKRSGTVKQISLEGGTLKAAANLGCIVGQIGFGLLGDIFGRRRVWPAGLVVTIIGTVLLIAAPLSLGPVGVFTWITVMRVIMGIGIGGDYPMSSAAISDRSSTNRRGMLLAFTFSMQGWGNLAGGIVTIVVLTAYKSSIQAGEVSKLNGVWRLIFGVILVPCLGTLYQRIVLPESTKYKNARALQEDPDLLKKGYIASDVIDKNGSGPSSFDAEKKHSPPSSEAGAIGAAEINPDTTNAGLGASGVAKQRRAALSEFIEYFSEPKHALTLFGTASTWFLLDIAFYGINLNQSIVLTSIGYNNNSSNWRYLHDNTVGNLIITVAGFLPGYWASILTIEYIGRKPIQLIGFFMTSLFLWIVAGTFDELKHKPAAFVVCFALLQFFFNFGANTSTFINPSEVFPTRVRGFAHGFSAASGKVGAVLASLVFSIANTKVGTAKVLWIFGAINILGGIITIFCMKETKGYDADVVDVQERQAKAGLADRVTSRQ